MWQCAGEQCTWLSWLCRSISSPFPQGLLLVSLWILLLSSCFILSPISTDFHPHLCTAWGKLSKRCSRQAVRNFQAMRKIWSFEWKTSNLSTVSYLKFFFFSLLWNLGSVGRTWPSRSRRTPHPKWPCLTKICFYKIKLAYYEMISTTINWEETFNLV